MKIKIKDIEVDIIEVKNKDNIIYTNNDEWQIGWFSIIDQVIYIYSELSDALKYQTLVHELTHAFIHIYNVDISDEENICDFFGIYGKDIIKIANNYFDSVCITGKYLKEVD